jgi:hypothetical protein
MIFFFFLLKHGILEYTKIHTVISFLGRFAFAGSGAEEIGEETLAQLSQSQRTFLFLGRMHTHAVTAHKHCSLW